SLSKGVFSICATGSKVLSELKLTLPASCKKNNIETGQGYCKSLAAAPLGVANMRFNAKPGLHLK
ncbi:MAG: hypothetical protein Q7V12_10775, partial [Deltaproteobacteria bacterium]|nr:hypothetical protein [Deltaproteobacteria bacterium]